MTTPKVFRIISFFLVVFLFAPVLQACETTTDSYQEYGVKIRLSPDYEYLIPVPPEGIDYWWTYYYGIADYQYLNERNESLTCDGYYTWCRVDMFEELYGNPARYAAAKEELNDNVSGYDPLEVFPNAVYLPGTYDQGRPQIWAQAVTRSEEEARDFLLGKFFVNMIKNNRARSQEERIGESGIVLTTYWGTGGPIRARYRIDKDDRYSEVVDASFIWMKAIFTYKNVAYCISVPVLAPKLFFDDPEFEDKSNGDKRTALSNTNVALAEPYMTELSRTLFDLLFAPRIPELNQ